jgi:hypothetical protein
MLHGTLGIGKTSNNCHTSAGVEISTECAVIFNTVTEPFYNKAELFITQHN